MDAKALGRRIRDARVAAKLTQEAVASRLGVQGPRVAEWEKGKHRPRPETLEKLAAIYGVDTAALAGAEEAPVGDDPRVWHGEMRATLKTLGSVRRIADELSALAASAESSVRGLVDSGVLLAGAPPLSPPPASASPGTAAPGMTEEEFVLEMHRRGYGMRPPQRAEGGA